MIKVEKSLFRDSGEIVDLELKSTEFPLSVELIKMFFTVEEREAFIARVSKKAIGSALVSYDKEDKICYIHSLAVHPDFRCLGVSRKLLESVSSCASTFGIRKLVLKVPHYQIDDMSDPYNIREWLDKTGFKFAKLENSILFRYGVYYDEYIYERDV
jgi:N-acetylglutamate synthase-like GNAT family acetyltransferase